MWLETFCDIHHKIDLHMLSTQLNLDIADAEEVRTPVSFATVASIMLSCVQKHAANPLLFSVHFSQWMVDLIVHRDSEGSDPKIDKEAGQIVMGKKFPSMYVCLKGYLR